MSTVTSSRPRSTSSRPRIVAILITLLVASSVVRAGVVGEVAVFPVVVNQVGRGEVIAAVGEHDVYVAVQSLEKLGVTGFGGVRENIDGEEYVSLRSIDDVLTYVIDPATLVLGLDVNPAHLAGTALTVRQSTPSAMDLPTATAAFFNYSVGGSRNGSISAFGEAGMSLRGNLLLSTFSRTPVEGVVRGLTSFRIDQRRSRRRWTLGDAYSGTNAGVIGPDASLAGGPLIGGVTVSRDYGLDPYFVRYPTSSLEGVANVPSTVEVYVNGVLADRTEVPPGPFKLDDVPLVGGRGDVRLVIRDIFGREQVQTYPYYYSTSVLARGMSEYSYSLGLIRENLGSESFDYGSPALVAQHRLGLTDSLTAGYRLEASRQVVSGGGSANLGTRIGDWESAFSVSRDDGEAGAAGVLGYRFLSRRFGAGVTWIHRTDAYATLSMSAADDRATNETTAFIGSHFGKVALALEMRHSARRDSTATRDISLNSSLPIGRVATLFTSISQRTEGESRFEGRVGISFSLGAIGSANVSSNYSDSRVETNVQLDKSLYAGEGFGYRADASVSDGRESGSVSVSHQSRFARLDATTNLRDPGQASLRASGGLLLVGSSLMPTRTVQGSFAIVRVGVPDVRVYVNNQEAGRTNARGEIFVPNLLAYHVNRISIEDKDIPIDYQIDAVERLVEPPNRGGVIVEFPVRRVQSVVGQIVLQQAAGDVTPAFGHLRVTSSAASADSPLGHEGEFYLEDLAAGEYAARISYAGQSCQMTLVVPQSEEAIVDVGVIRCRQ